MSDLYGPELVNYIKSYVLGWIESFQFQQANVSGGTAYAPAPHTLNGSYHTGVLDDSQAPQFLKIDGTRALTGDLAVSAGIKVDGYSISGLAGVPFVTIGSSAVTPNERALTAGAGISITDGGAGSTVTIASTVSSAVGANPTSTVGLAVVNGAAATFMRSDAAPPLSQAISPNWSNKHIFSAGLRIGYTNYALVDPGGKGDYTTIGAALAAVTSPTSSNQWIIEVNSGTYAENLTIPVYTTVRAKARGGVTLTGSGHTGQMVTLNGYGSIIEGVLCIDTVRTDSNYLVLCNAGGRILNSVIHVEKAVGAAGSTANPVSAVALTGNLPDNGPSLDNVTLYARSDATGDIVYALWCVYANQLFVKDVTATTYAYTGFSGVSAFFATDVSSNVLYMYCRTYQGGGNANTAFDFYTANAGAVATLQFCQYATAGGLGTTTIQQQASASVYGFVRWDMAPTWSASHAFSAGLTGTTATLSGALGAASATITGALSADTVTVTGILLATGTALNADIGQAVKPFKSLYAAELRVGTLVAQDIQATTGGAVKVGPTTSLIAALATVADTITLGNTTTNTGTSTTATGLVPASLLPGDVLVAWVYARTTAAFTAPAGWTVVPNCNNTEPNGRGAAYYHIVGAATEPASYDWTITSAAWTVGVAAYRNVDNAAPIHASQGAASAVNTTNHTGSTITTTVASCQLVFCAATPSGTAFGPDAATVERWDFANGAARNGMDDQVLAAAGATGTRVMTGALATDVTAMIALAPSWGASVKHNNLSVGDRIYAQANGNFEAMAVTAGPFTVSGGYSYQLARNLDGTGINTWNAGDALFDTGQTGNGFIDLYSQYSTVTRLVDFIYNFNATGSVYSANYAQSANWTPFGDGAGTEVNDAIYFGLANTSWHNLYFVLSTAASYVATLTWEFWNGAAWTSFVPTFVGNVAGDFKAVGWQGFEWTAASLTSWASSSVNGQAAFWVRVRLSAFTSWTTLPAQTVHRTYREAGNVGPAMVMWKRASSAWNDLTPIVALGNMAGFFGIAANVPGIGIGSFATSNYLRYDEANGFKIAAGSGAIAIDANGLTVLGVLQTVNFKANSTNVSGYIQSLNSSSSPTLLISSNTWSSGHAASINLQAGGIAQTANFIIATDDTTGWHYASFSNVNGTMKGLVVGGSGVPNYMLDVRGAAQITGAFGANGATPQTALASGGAAPAGGVGATAGAYDTAAHRDALITLVNNIRSALVANGIMS